MKMTSRNVLQWLWHLQQPYLPMAWKVSWDYPTQTKKSEQIWTTTVAIEIHFLDLNPSVNNHYDLILGILSDATFISKAHHLEVIQWCKLNCILSQTQKMILLDTYQNQLSQREWCDNDEQSLLKWVQRALWWLINPGLTHLDWPLLR